jgi:uncharacterized protein (TIGR00725 family)
LFYLLTNISMKKRKLQIGVIGWAGAQEYPADKVPAQADYVAAEKVGSLLARNGACVVTGGKSGVMESAARGAQAANGLTVGVVKGNKRFTSNQFTDVEILTGMAADGLDELMLVLMCDALIVVGGGAGTLQEIAIAYRNEKPTIALKNTGGWAQKVADTFLDERERVKVRLAKTPTEAVELAIRLAHRANPS